MNGNLENLIVGQGAAGQGCEHSGDQAGTPRVGNSLGRTVQATHVITARG